MKKLFLIIGLPETDINTHAQTIHCECMTYCDSSTLNISNCVEEIKEAPTQMNQLNERLKTEDGIEHTMVMELLAGDEIVERHIEEQEILTQIRKFYKQKKVYKALSAEVNPSNVCSVMETMIYSRADKLNIKERSYETY